MCVYLRMTISADPLPAQDNCMYVFNPEQGDSDYDRIGNACDNCQFVYNIDQIDTNWDGEGDRCDSDRDGDGILNNADNCPVNYNPSQRDTDRDRWGDACDNCISKWNRDQVGTLPYKEIWYWKP